MEEYSSVLEEASKVCPGCNRPFNAKVLKITMGGRTSTLIQGHCDACCAAHDMKDSGTKAGRQADWLLKEGWINQHTLIPSFKDSDKGMETADYDWARKWDARTGENVYIYGHKGRGKTYLGRCMLHAAVDAGLSVGEINAVEFIVQYDDNRGKKLKYLRNPQVILIDDIDKAAWGVFTFQHLYALLNHRVERGLKTIMTSNTTVDDLIEHLGKHIDNKGMINAAFDRMNPVVKVRMIGESFRKTPANVSAFPKPPVVRTEETEEELF